MKINVLNPDFNSLFDTFPILEQLEAIPQNPVFHREGNVKIHTEKVCRELTNLNEWYDLETHEKHILYMAAMFHDIGKISCTKTVDGVIVSPKHAIRGAKLFRELFYRYDSKKYPMDFELREAVAGLIKYHGLPLFFMEKDDIEYHLIRAGSSVSLKLLYLLSKADVLGRDCEDKETVLSRVEYFKEYSNEIGCFSKSKSFANEYTRYKYFNERNVWHGDDVFNSTAFDVFIMMGLPLAGKDSYIQKNFPLLPMVSLDDIREEFNMPPQLGSGKTVTIAKERAKEYLRKKQPFVWNATNVIKDNRDKLCRLFADYGARVNFIYIETPYEELLKRNVSRERKVPESVIDRMLHNLDMIENFEGYKVTYVINEGQ